MLGHKTTRTTGENPHHNTSWRNVQLQEWVKLGLEFKMWECPAVEHSDHSAHHPKKQSEQWYSNKSARFCWEDMNFIYKLLSFDQESLVNSQRTRIWYFKTLFCCEIQVFFPVLPSWGDLHIRSKSPVVSTPHTSPDTQSPHFWGVWGCCSWKGWNCLVYSIFPLPTASGTTH